MRMGIMLQMVMEIGMVMPMRMGTVIQLWMWMVMVKEWGVGARMAYKRIPLFWSRLAQLRAHGPA